MPFSTFFLPFPPSKPIFARSKSIRRRRKGEGIVVRSFSARIESRTEEARERMDTVLLLLSSFFSLFSRGYRKDRNGVTQRGLARKTAKATSLIFFFTTSFFHCLFLPPSLSARK